MTKHMTTEESIAAMITMKLGRCAGCGQPGSWDETTYGHTGPDQHPAVWPGCDGHNQATGEPVFSEVYDRVYRAAKHSDMTVDDFLNLGRIKAFIRLPKEAKPSADWRGSDDPLAIMRDMLVPEENQQYDHDGDRITLRADRDGWRDGVAVYA
jgi:hypothetical protein